MTSLTRASHSTALLILPVPPVFATSPDYLYVMWNSGETGSVVGSDRCAARRGHSCMF